VKTIQGPGIFLAQFMDDQPPYDTLDHLAEWTASLGYVGVQIPTWDSRCIDLELAANSNAYCDELRGRLARHGLVITELSTHLQGQLIAIHPGTAALAANFAPAEYRHSTQACSQWAQGQLLAAARASQRLGLSAHVTFSGALLWPMVYPWPPRPVGLVEEGFTELARRWRPILDAFDAAGVDVCFEIHPGEDLHDGVTFERFLEATGTHPRANILYDPSHLLLQQIDYLQFLHIYHNRIRAVHVKDAEFRPNGRSGLYGGYQSWLDRPGRFRSLGDGQIDFGGIFSLLAQHSFPGWAVVEWECALKHPAVGAREGAPFVRRHIIQVSPRGFDDFAASNERESHANRRILGLDR
jgi:sugar phosphate isomerase/epimerase